MKFLAHKSEAAEALIGVIMEWENQHTSSGHTVKAVRSDRGGEFVNRELQLFFRWRGIQHQKVAPYSPEQNGKAERLNRTLVESARAMLASRDVPKLLWADAVHTACYVRNLSPSTGRDKTPWELFHGTKPDVSHLRPYGCNAYVLMPPRYRQGKMSPVAARGILVGYDHPDGNKAFRLFFPKSPLGTTFKYHTSKDVQFDVPGQAVKWVPEKPNSRLYVPADPEPDPYDPVTPAGSPGATAVTDAAPPAPATTAAAPDPAAGAPSPAPTRAPSAEPDQPAPMDTGGDASPEAPVEAPEAPPSPPSPAARYPKRQRRAPAHLQDYVVNSAVGGIPTPTDLDEAYASLQSEQWKQAVGEEMSALLCNNTWELVELPANRKAIPCKWVFKVKQDSQGNVERFKARLVAKGFAQRHGTDYNEIYAPVSKHVTVRTCLAYAALRDMEIRQIDIKTAFLNGDLEEEIYMKQPPGFHEGGPNVVCKLQKSLYGLKQAPRAWYLKLSEVLTSLGFSPSQADAALFMKGSGAERVYLLAYVDDCLIFAPKGKTAVLDQVVSSLKAAFDMRDLGEASTFLGIDIARDRSTGTLSMSQSGYINQLLEKYGMLDANPRCFPLDPGIRLQRKGDALDEGFVYSELIGSLLYLSVCTRPDISFAVGALARYMSAPTEQHWAAAKGILRYLHGTRDVKLTFGHSSSSAELLGYCDADYAGDVDTRKSTTGFAFMFNGGVISWSSKLQATVATSTCESEYIAAAACTKEALWLRKLFADFSPSPDSVRVYCDNQSALSVITNPVITPRSKHIDVAHHFVRERAARREVEFSFVESAKQLADILTKALPKDKFLSCRIALGMK